MPVPHKMPVSEPRTIADVEMKMLHGELRVHDLRLERCVFDNAGAHGTVAQRVEVVDCSVWSCVLDDVVIEDCTVHNLKTSLGGGGKRIPFFLNGVFARHLTLSGTIGSVIWNPPRADGIQASAPAVAAARRYYAAVDWALDVSEARFRSVPSLRFGPPGRLIRRDPETQPLITRVQAALALHAAGRDIGVWRVVLEDFVESAWPDEIVLLPPLGARKAQREEDLAGLAQLRSIGACDASP